jgi:hypothetical protein
VGTTRTSGGKNTVIINATGLPGGGGKRGWEGCGHKTIVFPVACSIQGGHSTMTVGGGGGHTHRTRGHYEGGGEGGEKRWVSRNSGYRVSCTVIHLL